MLQRIGPAVDVQAHPACMSCAPPITVFSITCVGRCKQVTGRGFLVDHRDTEAALLQRANIKQRCLGSGTIYPRSCSTEMIEDGCSCALRSHTFLSLSLLRRLSYPHVARFDTNHVLHFLSISQVRSLATTSASMCYNLRSAYQRTPEPRA